MTKRYIPTNDIELDATEMAFTDAYDEDTYYTEQFNLNKGARTVRHRKTSPNHRPKKDHDEILKSIAQATGVEGGFRTTYQPARYETGWMFDAIRSFYDEELISDVLAMVKGGKEASVYRCQATPAADVDLLAVKIYRPRQFRNLRNDKMYREGRALMGENGPLGKVEERTRRALNKGTAFGQQVAHNSWLLYEYHTLAQLHKAGAAVPKPYSVSENAILMEFCGDRNLAAPTLHEIRLEHDEARGLFNEVMRNIELMLQHDLIHGDLSAYNILYWESKVTLIDFPQVANSQKNSHGYDILHRDITRVCDYFAHQGVQRDADQITDTLWGLYTNRVMDDAIADWSKFSEEEELD